MLNKKDPLIDAIQQVMQSNQADRDAVKAVNEKFGIQDRRVLPRERQAEWDAAYKSVLTEGLHPNQQKLDVHEPEKDKLTKHDFKMLRAKNKPMEEAKKMKGDDPCWDNYEMIGMKKGKGGKSVPNCVPVSEEGDPSKAIRGDVVTGGSSVTTAPSRPTSVTPADQSALKKKIQSIKEAKKAAMCEDTLEEKAVSKAQQRFMGLVRGIQKGKAQGSPEAEKAAETMSAKEVKKFAGTKQKGLPEKKTVKEGFNNRHNSSVNASADKQVVADQLNEKVGNPLLLNKAKTETKPKARIGDTGIRKTISGTNDVQTRLANLKKKPTALDTKRDAELDKAGLEKAGVSQALKDPKAREVLTQTTKDAANFAVPSAMTGGPVGSMITRGVIGGVTKGYGLVKNALVAGKTTATAAKPVVSAAAREGGSAVPKITKGTGQGNRIAAQRKPADGPWGSTKPPEVKPSTRLAPSGTFAANLQRARQTAQSGRVGGSTVGATQQAAKLAVRQRLSATAKDIRAGVGKVANTVKSNPKMAAGAAAGTALAIGAASMSNRQQPSAAAQSTTQTDGSTSTIPVPKAKPVVPQAAKPPGSTVPAIKKAAPQPQIQKSTLQSRTQRDDTIGASGRSTKGPGGVTSGTKTGTTMTNKPQAAVKVPVGTGRVK